MSSYNQNMENNEYIEEIILRVLSGSASEEERLLVDNWKESSEDNFLLFEEYKKTNQIWNNYSLTLKVDTKKGLEELNKKIEPQKKTNKFFVKYAKVAAILLPLIIAGSLYFYLDRDIPQNTELTRKVIASYGTRNQIFLPDGTEVWLNAGSSLEYPLVFKGNKREVKLTGEAFFEVVKNPEKPFYVKAENMYVKALGTSFNVRSYPEEDIIEATLLSGNVHIVTREGSVEKTLAKMKPDQHVILEKEKNILTLIDEKEEITESTKTNNKEKTKTETPLQAKVSNNKHTSWVSGKLIFRNDSMEEIARRLGKWYNVEIILSDKEVKDYRYTATFTNETLEQVLELLTLSAPLDYEIIERNRALDESYTKKQVIVYLNN